MIELIKQPKKKETYADIEERKRYEALEYFETVQMDAFLKAIADEMTMDQASVLSLAYYAAMYGLQAIKPNRYQDHLEWTVEFTIIRSGWTPVEVLHYLARSYKRIHMDWINIARHYNDFKFAEKLQARNSISTLARILFYNDPANRFQAVIK